MRSKREPPTEQQIAEAFRALANEHAAEREPFDKRRAWHALQYAHRTLRAPARSARVRWALALGVFALGIAVGAPAWQAWTMLRYEAHGLSTEGSYLNARETPADLAFFRRESRDGRPAHHAQRRLARQASRVDALARRPAARGRAPRAGHELSLPGGAVRGAGGRYRVRSRVARASRRPHLGHAQRRSPSPR